jgi:hypothetical protein
MDIFTTGVLRRVVRALPPGEQQANFILNTFFRFEQLDQSEEIHFDVETDKRRIAPFVAPIVAGQVVASQGYQTKTFRPAYIKDKRVFNAQRPLKRLIGEQPMGAISPAARMQALLANDLQDQINMLNRRLELMAVEALRTGKVIIKGEQYPEVEVNFQRHGDLTVALTSTKRWGEAGVNPIRDLDAWALRIAIHSGAVANIVVMDPKAYELFEASEPVQKLLDRTRASDTLSPTNGELGAVPKGRIGNYEVWVYTDHYVHPETGETTFYLPDYTVLLVSPSLEGTRCFAAIQDEEANFEALPYFPKSWLEKDPAVRYLLMQSAPLMVPYRVNAALCATVR